MCSHFISISYVVYLGILFLEGDLLGFLASAVPQFSLKCECVFTRSRHRPSAQTPTWKMKIFVRISFLKSDGFTMSEEPLLPRVVRCVVSSSSAEACLAWGLCW